MTLARLEVALAAVVAISVVGLIVEVWLAVPQ